MMLLSSSPFIIGCSNETGRTVLEMPEGEEIDELRKLSSERLPPGDAMPKK